jgi:hypothetical protein
MLAKQRSIRMAGPSPVTDIPNHPLKTPEKLLKSPFWDFSDSLPTIPQISLSKILWISACNPKTYEGESYRMDLPFYWPKAVFLGPAVNP